MKKLVGSRLVFKMTCNSSEDKLEVGVRPSEKAESRTARLEFGDGYENWPRAHLTVSCPITHGFVVGRKYSVEIREL